MSRQFLTLPPRHRQLTLAMDAPGAMICFRVAVSMFLGAEPARNGGNAPLRATLLFLLAISGGGAGIGLAVSQDALERVKPQWIPGGAHL